MTKSAFAADGLGMEDSGTEDTSLHQVVHAALYPSFILTIGVIAYFVFSRYLHYLQYTAMMFIIGTLMGFGIYAEQLVTPDCVEKHECYMTDTVKAWTSVDSELLLNVFLPGLIFKDALGQNPYLFSLGFGQIFIFAFPCVLAGTFLTGLVAFYALPNQWPFFLCLTFGSILSATDPVAVSALLAEVGRFLTATILTSYFEYEAYDCFLFMSRLFVLHIQAHLLV
jgi:NhaP-type Na+/H+ or K+/H+ antiporter